MELFQCEFMRKTTDVTEVGFAREIIQIHFHSAIQAGWPDESVKKSAKMLTNMFFNQHKYSTFSRKKHICVITKKLAKVYSKQVTLIQVTKFLQS
jgi:hypothetical protein